MDNDDEIDDPFEEEDDDDNDITSEDNDFYDNLQFSA